MTLAAILVILIVSFALALFKPRTALFAAVFLVPWQGLYVDVGLGVTPYLVLIASLFAISLLAALARRKKAKRVALGAFILVIAYAVIWSLSQIPFLPESIVGGGVLRQPAVRSTLQIVMFLITISPLWIVPMYMRARSDLISIGSMYIISCALLAFVGWLQIVIWIATGTDPLPIGFINGLLGGGIAERSGIFHVMDVGYYRMSSLAGEPKNLGVVLAVALLLLQSGAAAKLRHAKWLWVFFFVSMVATLSTMALLGWLGASLFQLLIGPKLTFKLPTARLLRDMFRWSFALILLLFVAVFAEKYIPIFDLIELRTTGRVSESESGVLEDFNVAVLDFLVDQPIWALTGTGLGNVHLYADAYLPDWAVWAHGATFVAKSGALRWVSELGVISLLVFIYWVLVRINRSVVLGHQFRQFSDLAGIASRFALPLMALWAVSAYVTPQFYATIGACIALGLMARAARYNVANGLSDDCSTETAAQRLAPAIVRRNRPY